MKKTDRKTDSKAHPNPGVPSQPNKAKDIRPFKPRDVIVGGKIEPQKQPILDILALNIDISKYPDLRRWLFAVDTMDPGMLLTVMVTPSIVGLDNMIRENSKRKEE